MGRRGSSPAFRRRVLDLVTAGRKVADVARDLGLSQQTIDVWRHQDRIDRGPEPGLVSAEREELRAAKRRIRELETEIEVHRRAPSCRAAQGDHRPKRRFAAVAVMAQEHRPVGVRCRALGVSVSGYHAQRSRPPSPRSIHHTWPSDLIIQIHEKSRCTYGARRVLAELTLGEGIVVGHQAVETLRRRAGIQGVCGRPKSRSAPHSATASDLVERQFGRTDRDRLWVTDITEHLTREGKCYCCVVLDVFGRGVVGWSIDSAATVALVTNALGMAIVARSPESAVIHTDHGTQGRFNGSSQRRVADMSQGTRPRLRLESSIQASCGGAC